eukprot:TRINITY_DN23244_c0_g1_i1.p1 TRINITY_DN23244_c0_g1~~TRINITY_DN23244_c0_g1_i1.p1  ORF type:complete len:607 (+),score=64.01 TRINITY_DN23244_c0_g1_i1:216-2036(+)
MLSDLRFGRTAKLRVVYHHPCLNYHLSSAALVGRLKDGDAQSPFAYALGVGAVLKVPQSLFPIEPYAEYVAFEVDRLMHLNLIPPTTWLFVPISAIEEATMEYQNSPEAVAAQEKKAETAGGAVGGGGNTTSASGVVDDQSSHPPKQGVSYEYGRWFSQEVLRYATEKNLVVVHPTTGEKMLGCSVQLWLGNAGLFNSKVKKKGNAKPDTVHQLVNPAFHGPKMPRITPLDFDNTYTTLLSRPSYIRALGSLPLTHTADYHNTASTYNPRKGFFTILEGGANQRYRGQMNLLESAQNRKKVGVQELAELDYERRQQESVQHNRQQSSTTAPKRLPSSSSPQAGPSLSVLLQRHPGLKKSVLYSKRRRANFHTVLQYISDQLLFDSIIGNDDRDSIKNAHVQSLLLGAIMQHGGNETSHVVRCLIDSLRGDSSGSGSTPRMSAIHDKCLQFNVSHDPHISTSYSTLGLVADAADGGDATAMLLERRHRFVLIDQGKSFYVRYGGPKKSIPLSKVAALRSSPGVGLEGGSAEGGLDPVCVFRRSTVMRLHSIGRDRLLTKLEHIVPRPLLNVVGAKRLGWAQDRVNLLLIHIERCVHAYGEEAVFLWE